MSTRGGGGSQKFQKSVNVVCERLQMDKNFEEKIAANKCCQMCFSDEVIKQFTPDYKSYRMAFHKRFGPCFK